MKQSFYILFILFSISGCQPNSSKTDPPVSVENKVPAGSKADSTGHLQHSRHSGVAENILNRYTGSTRLVQAIDSMLMAEQDRQPALHKRFFVPLLMLQPKDIHDRQTTMPPGAEPVAAKGGPYMWLFLESNELYSFVYSEWLLHEVNFIFYKKKLIYVHEKCFNDAWNSCGGMSFRTQYFFQGRQIYKTTGFQLGGKIFEGTRRVMPDNGCWCLPRTKEDQAVLRILQKCMKTSATLRQYFNTENGL